MLSNAYFLANIRFDTAENEPAKHLQTFANLLKIANFANFVLSPPIPLDENQAAADRAPARPPAGPAGGAPPRQLRRGAVALEEVLRIHAAHVRF